MNLKDKNSLIYILPIILLNMVAVAIVIAVLTLKNINVKLFVLIAMISILISALINGIREIITEEKKGKAIYYFIMVAIIFVCMFIVI